MAMGDYCQRCESPWVLCYCSKRGDEARENRDRILKMKEKQQKELKMAYEKKRDMYVTKLKKGQVVKTSTGKSFTVNQDETSIYIPEDITLKKGDKLYLNPIKSTVDRLTVEGKITEDKAADWLKRAEEFNQTHTVTIFNKK